MMARSHAACTAAGDADVFVFVVLVGGRELVEVFDVVPVELPANG